MKIRKTQSCPHPETCPVRTPNGICEGDCADKILVEYYILKQKYEKLQIQNMRMFDTIMALKNDMEDNDGN